MLKTFCFAFFSVTTTEFSSDRICSHRKSKSSSTDAFKYVVCINFKYPLSLFSRIFLERLQPACLAHSLLSSSAPLGTAAFLPKGAANTALAYVGGDFSSPPPPPLFFLFFSPFLRIRYRTVDRDIIVFIMVRGRGLGKCHVLPSGLSACLTAEYVERRRGGGVSSCGRARTDRHRLVMQM